MANVRFQRKEGLPVSDRMRYIPKSIVLRSEISYFVRFVESVYRNKEVMEKRNNFFKECHNVTGWHGTLAEDGEAVLPQQVELCTISFKTPMKEPLC